MAAVPEESATADFEPNLSANDRSNSSTFLPNGAIQLLSKASLIYCSSYPSSLIWGDDRYILLPSVIAMAPPA